MYIKKYQDFINEGKNETVLFSSSELVGIVKSMENFKEIQVPSSRTGGSLSVIRDKNKAIKTIQERSKSLNTDFCIGWYSTPQSDYNRKEVSKMTKGFLLSDLPYSDIIVLDIPDAIGEIPFTGRRS